MIREVFSNAKKIHDIPTWVSVVQSNTDDTNMAYWRSMLSVARLLGVVRGKWVGVS